jgi:hypothetical protein
MPFGSLKACVSLVSREGGGGGEGMGDNAESYDRCLFLLCLPAYRMTG